MSIKDITHECVECGNSVETEWTATTYWQDYKICQKCLDKELNEWREFAEATDYYRR